MKIKTYSYKKRQTVVNREKMKKNKERYDRNYSLNRGFSGKKFALFCQRKRELNKDPETSHPLSLEEFDSIIDITENYNNKVKENNNE